MFARLRLRVCELAYRVSIWRQRVAWKWAPASLLIRPLTAVQSCNHVTAVALLLLFALLQRRLQNTPNVAEIF